MKVQLKRLQICANLSEETTAFTADVWIDGKKAGWAKNDGHGGATIVHVGDRAIHAALREHGAALVPAEYKSFTPGDEWVVDRLVEEACVAKELARVAKKAARLDVEYRESCATRGTHAARFKTDGATTRWVEYQDEATARRDAEKRFGTISDWTVLA